MAKKSKGVRRLTKKEIINQVFELFEKIPGMIMMQRRSLQF